MAEHMKGGYPEPTPPSVPKPSAQGQQQSDRTCVDRDHDVNFDNGERQHDPQPMRRGRSGGKFFAARHVQRSKVELEVQRSVVAAYFVLFLFFCFAILTRRPTSGAAEYKLDGRSLEKILEPQVNDKIMNML